MKSLTAISILTAIFLLTGCSKDDSADNNKVVITGTIPDNVKSAGFKSDFALSLQDATKVLVFNSSGSYEIFNIENNSFTARASAGTATALVFLDGNNAFIGCLHAGGLNVLPLVSLTDGENTIIDLSNLTLDGTHVIPANDPIGSSIVLNEDELERYRQLGSFYASLARNLDADNDGVPDIVDNKALYVSTIFDVYSGNYGVNGTSPQIIDTSRLFTNYAVRISGGKSLKPVNPQIILEGPEDSPYPDIMLHYYTDAPDCFISFFSRETRAPEGYPFGSAFLPFANGRYNLILDEKNYSIYYSNVNVRYFFVLAVPTVKTDESGMISSVTVEYKDVYGNMVNPENFVYQTMIQLNGVNANQLCQIGTLWENPEAKSNTELYTFIPNKSVNISELAHVTVCYLDLLGNAYNVGFNKQ